jgi:hypothetical protein
LNSRGSDPLHGGPSETAKASAANLLVRKRLIAPDHQL